MITKQDMVGRDRRENHRSKSEHGKQQTYLWACNGDKRVCPMKEHPRIRCAVHGSAEEAMKCIEKSMRLRQEESNDR